MAERMEGNHLRRSSRLAGALQQLETTANTCPNEGSPTLNDFVALCRTAERLASDVAGDLPTGTLRIGDDALPI